MIIKNDSKKYIAIVFMASIVVIFFSIGECNKIKLDGDHRYTIGTIGDYNKVRFKYEYDYSFCIDGKFYEGRSRGTKVTPSKMKGRKFFIKFYTLDPSISEIILDKQASDSLIIPAEGWLELPKVIK